MPSNILIKRSSTASAIPTAQQLLTGELAINLADKKLYTNNNGSIIELGTLPSSLSVSGDTALTGSLGVTGATTLTDGNVSGDFTVVGTLTVSTPTSGTDAASKAYVDTSISSVIDSSPALLNTLNELAAAINDDPSFATTVANSVATKVNKAGDTLTGDLVMGGNKITSTATPVTDDTLTRKGYVDTILGSATAAATSATNSATSATSSANSASSASTSAATATTKASEASTSATNAATSASSASASASSASASASSASTSASSASTSEANAESAWDSFEQRYLGSLATAPTPDSDIGSFILEGSLYWNSVSDKLFAYTGSTWVVAASEASATAAAISASAALTSKNNAAVSASAASASETASATSESNAATSAANALASETASATSETNSASSASAALTSETNSAASELAVSNNLTNMDAVTKADFFAQAEKRIRDSAGSGFAEWGKHRDSVSNSYGSPVNQGITAMWYEALKADSFTLGWTGDSAFQDCVSRTDSPNAVVNGVSHVLDNNLNATSGWADNKVKFPPAPDGTKTYDSATGSVVEHASAAEAFEGLVTNGDFRDGTTGYTSGVGNGTVVITDGVARFDKGTHTRVILGYTGIGNNLEIGTTYNITYVIAGIDDDFANDIGITIRLNSSDLAAFTIPNDAIFPYTMTAQITATQTDDAAFGFYLNATASTWIDVLSLSVMPVTESVITSRQDFTFLESFHEKISDKDVVYPLGNVQYGASSWEGVTLSNTVEAQGYSAFGEWDTATKGYGVVWSTLSDANKAKFLQDPENNIYNDDGELIQVRYRIRVIEGLGDEWANVTPESGGVMRYTNGSEMSVKARGLSTTFTDLATGGDGVTFYSLDQADNISNISGTWALHQNVGNISHGKGMVFAVPIALVQRRNQGAYSPVHNPNGCRGIRLNSTRHWYNAEAQITSTQVCFTKNVTGTVNGYNVGTGAIGQGSFRPDNKFYDVIYASDVQDLRMSSKLLPRKEIREKYKRMAIAGDVRGFEGVPFTEVHNQSITTSSSPVGALLALGVADSSRMQVGDIVSWARDAGATVYSTGWIGAVASSTQINVYNNDRTVISIRNINTTVLVATQQTHKQASPTWTDIIGDPANIAATFPNGVEGQWVPDLTLISSFEANRKWVSIVGAERTLDNGGTWTSPSPGGIASSNRVYITDDPMQVALFHYETQAHFTSDDVNSEVLDLGSVSAINSSDTRVGTILESSLINKIGTSSTSVDKGHEYSLIKSAIWYPTGALEKGSILPEHAVIDLSTVSPAVKTLDYLSAENGVAKLMYAYKEMVYDFSQYSSTVVYQGEISYAIYVGDVVKFEGFSTIPNSYFIRRNSTSSGTMTNANTSTLGEDLNGDLVIAGVVYWEKWDGNGFGDNNQFEITNNQATQTDDNGNTVLYGTASFNTQYFIVEE